MKAYAYAYLRRSIGREDEGSIETSREDVQRLAEKLGAELPADRIYVDDDVSGSKLRGGKTEWQRFLGDLRAAPPAYVLAAKYDRIGRRLGDLETLEEMSRELGFRVWTVADGDLFKTSWWPMLAAFAKVEASNTRERVLRAQERRRASGKPSGGPGTRPYGFRTGGTEIEPSEAAVIRECVRRVRSGEAILSVTRWLNAEHPKETPWRPSGVSRMLRNPRIAGLLTHRGEVIGEAAWPGIITPDEHRALVAAMAQVKPGRKETSLLAGVVRCGRDNCDARMASDRDKNGHRVYRCKKNLGGCSRLTRRRDDVDAYVLRELFQRLNATKINEEWERCESEARENAGEQAQVMLDIGMLRDRYARGDVATADYYATLDALRRRERKLREQEQEISTRWDAVARADHAQDSWDEMDLDQRRQVIRDAIAAVRIFPHGRTGKAALEIRPGEIEIVWI